MRQYISLFLFSSMLLVVACNESSENKQSTDTESNTQASYLHKEIIRVHDEVMPLMKDIAQFQEALKLKLDSLSQLDSIPEGLVQDLQTKKLSLNASAASMMSWMKNYREPKNGTPEQEAMLYLEEEKRKIDEIAKDFEKQMSENKALLN